MLIPFWFNASSGLGYGVTATSQEDAVQLLKLLGYPRPGEELTKVVAGVAPADLDQNHVIPNAGPLAVRGVWFPMHNV